MDSNRCRGKNRVFYTGYNFLSFSRKAKQTPPLPRLYYIWPSPAVYAARIIFSIKMPDPVRARLRFSSQRTEKAYTVAVLYTSPALRTVEGNSG